MVIERDRTGWEESVYRVDRAPVFAKKCCDTNADARSTGGFGVAAVSLISARFLSYIS